MRAQVSWILKACAACAAAADAYDVLQADAIVFDLEDAVPATHKASARVHLTRLLHEVDAACAVVGSHRPFVIVRVNAPAADFQGGADSWAEQDLLELLRNAPHGVVHAVMVPKVSSAAQLRGVADFVTHHGGAPWQALKLIPLLETAAGIGNAMSIAAATPRNAALLFGSYDLAADVGAARADVHAMAPFRAQALLAARAAGISAIDTAFVNIHDTIGAAKEARQARELGFDGKVCLHPSLVPVTQLEMSSSPAQLQAAHRLLAAVSSGQGSSVGMTRVPALKGELVGPPMVTLALDTLRRAPSVVPREAAATASEPDSEPPSMVAPAYGLNLASVHVGHTIVSPLEVTLTPSLAQTWMSAFFEPSPLVTSVEAARSVGLTAPLMPFSFVYAALLGMAVINFSENAHVYLGMRDVQLHSPMITTNGFGENASASSTIRNRAVITALRNTSKGDASVITSLHTLVDTQQRVLASCTKMTMFDAIPASNDRVHAPPPAPPALPSRALFEGGFEFMRTAPTEALSQLRAPFELTPGVTIVHRITKSFSASENQTLVNALRVTNQHHINSLQFAPTELLIAGPFSIAAALSASSHDLGPLLWETVHSTQQLNKVNAGDMLCGVTHVCSVADVPGCPHLELVRAVTYGIKNVDTRDVLALRRLPAWLTADQHDVAWKPQDLEAYLLQTCNTLYHKIVTKLHRSFIRVKAEPGSKAPQVH